MNPVQKMQEAPAASWASDFLQNQPATAMTQQVPVQMNKDIQVEAQSKQLSPPISPAGKRVFHVLGFSTQNNVLSSPLPSWSIQFPHEFDAYIYASNADPTQCPPTTSCTVQEWVFLFMYQPYNLTECS